MALPRASDLRKRENFEDGNFSVLYNLYLKVTYYHFCNIALFIDPPWYSVGGDYTRLEHQEVGSFGTILGVGTKAK